MTNPAASARWSRRRFLLVAALANACRRGSADPVQALLDELEAAAEARDATRFGERLSPSFRSAQGQGRADIVAEVRRYFALYETVGITVYGVEAERSGSSAKVRCVVEFVGEAKKLGAFAGMLPPEAAYRFTLDVADEDGTWRVTAASWELAEPSRR